MAGYRCSASSKGSVDLTPNPDTSVTPEKRGSDLAAEVKKYLQQKFRQSKFRQWRENDIMPRKDLTKLGVTNFRVVRVVSPCEFYLQLVYEDLIPSYDSWFKRMQTFYEDPAQSQLCQLGFDEVEVGRCYVIKDVEDGQWHRCRVHAIDGKTFAVYYCDLGKSKVNVKETELRRIQPEFTQPAAHLYRAHLANVEPVSTSDLQWPEDACFAFREMVLGKTYGGEVLTRVDSFVKQGQPDIWMNVGVLLMEHKIQKGGEKKCSDWRTTINARMVEMGFARTKGIIVE